MRAIDVKIATSLFGVFVATNSYSFYVLSKLHKEDCKFRKLKV